ncbi:MAG TPA: response regulator transcription factor [Dehalococcoidia bacterium]|nr:response regulator transcription factor [Dehalococcoidia bacterium]
MDSPGRTGPTDPLIFVVDDDVSVANLIVHALQFRDYRCKAFYSGRSMLEEIRNDHPDLIILDVIMPGIDGVAVARQVRRFSKVPIMMLSVRSDAGFKATALEVGADDYLTKPFDIDELLARVRSLLRRLVPYRREQTSQVYRSGELRVDLENSLVTLGERTVHLTRREWSVLRVLVKYVGQVVPPRRMLQEAWGPDYGDEGEYVRAYITRLRRKLEPDPRSPRYILLEWGVGYRLADPESPAGS